MIPGCIDDPGIARLARIILWLNRTPLGRAFLLASASSIILSFVHVSYPNRFFLDTWVAKVLEPANRIGLYFGTVVFPVYGRPGQTGTYLVPLFGFGAAFLLWWALWFLGMKGMARARTSLAAGRVLR